jgi:hypothetical protein
VIQLLHSHNAFHSHAFQNVPFVHVFLDVPITYDFLMPPLASLSHVFQDVPLAHAFLDALIVCDFCHAPSCSWLLCDVPIPFTGNPMAPSHDVPLACASW